MKIRTLALATVLAVSASGIRENAERGRERGETLGRAREFRAAHETLEIVLLFVGEVCGAHVFVLLLISLRPARPRSAPKTPPRG